MSDTESACSDIVTTPPGFKMEPDQDLVDLNYSSSYPNECVCCLESLPDSSYPIPCCLRPLCQDCATALTQPGQSLICPNCGLTNSQDSTSNLSCDDLVIKYLIHRSAKLTVDIKSLLRQYYQALKQLKSDQEHNNANVAKILHHIGSKTNPVLLQQLRYHDKNFQLAIEQNQTVVRQLQSCVQYLTSLPTRSDVGKVSNFTNPLVFLTRLAQGQACYDRIQRESKIVEYHYEPLQYHYHPLGSSVGPNHLINKLRQLSLAQKSTDPGLQPYKTIVLAEKNPEYEQMCGEYWHSWFSQCGCHLGGGDLGDSLDPQLVEYRCYSGGIIIIHYTTSSKLVITPLVVPYPVIRTFNCEYVVFQTIMDSAEFKQLSVISVEALIMNCKAGLVPDTTATVLLEPGGTGTITDLALTPDKILVTCHQGIYYYDLADLARPIRELLPTSTGDLVLTEVLVPRLVLVRFDVIRIEPCGVYFYTIFTGDDRYYRPTGFGQIDLESLGQSDPVESSDLTNQFNVFHDDIVVENMVIEDYIVLEDGSIIFESKARDAYGGGWSNDKQVCIWTGGQLHRQSRNDLVGLVGLNPRLTSQGDLMIFDEESDCVKFYREYRECQD